MRLLTLIGPPGIGKTRLALAVADAVQEIFPDGVCFVAFASITDPELVVPTIMQVLGLSEGNDTSPQAHLRAYLRDKQLLLLLDNFEQILEAAPLLVDLLVQAPQLTILVTSRTALRVRGEQLMPVPPLLLPDSANLPPTDQLAQNPVVTLFVDRARAVAPDFALTDEHAVAIATIKEGMLLYRETGDMRGVADCLAGVAGANGAQAQPIPAARLLGAADALRAAIGISIREPVDRVEYERNMAIVRAQLDEATFAAAWAEG
jgi:hypothetical protein